MKNACKLLGVIAITAVLVFLTVACEMDPGDDKVAKTLIITDIPDNADTAFGKQITVAICNTNKKGEPDIVALNQVTSASSVTIPLLSGNEKKKGGDFTGTGKFYIFLFFDVNNTQSDLKDDVAYAYGGGGNIPKTFDLLEAKSTISWNMFV